MNVANAICMIVKSPLTKKVVVTVAGVVAAYGTRLVTSKAYDSAFMPNAVPFKSFLDD